MNFPKEDSYCISTPTRLEVILASRSLPNNEDASRLETVANSRKCNSSGAISVGPFVGNISWSRDLFNGDRSRTSCGLLLNVSTTFLPRISMAHFSTRYVTLRIGTYNYGNGTAVWAQKIVEHPRTVDSMSTKSTLGPRSVLSTNHHFSAERKSKNRRARKEKSGDVFSENSNTLVSFNFIVTSPRYSRNYCIRRIGYLDPFRRRT